MNKHFKIFITILGLSVTTLAFQNCGADFNPEEYSTTQSSQGVPLPPVTPTPQVPASLAPKILSVSNPGTVGYFTATRLGVVASGENLKYQWYRDTSIIGGAWNATYEIPSANDATAGTYSVLVSNEHGQVMSSDMIFAVVRLPEQQGAPVITNKTANLVLPFLSPNAVPLSVTASGAGLRYSWSLITQDYANPGAFITTALPDTTSQIMTTRTSYVSEGTTLYFVNVGTYRVTVSNAFGESVSADIVVEYEPFVFSF